MKSPTKFLLLLMAAVILGSFASLFLGAPVLVGMGGIAALAFGQQAVAQSHNPYQLNVVTLSSLAWGDGDDNMGGLRTKAYWCMHSEVETHAAPVARSVATTFEQLSTITTDHTFVSGKGWKSIYTTEDTGMVESTMQGELDGKSWINKIKLFFPGGRAQVMGFLRYTQNAGLYFVGIDAEGAKRMVGSEHWPAKALAETITTTETAAGRKGATMEFQASSPWPAPIVTALISVEGDSESV